MVHLSMLCQECRRSMPCACQAGTPSVLPFHVASISARSGGTTMFPGIASRLEKELRTLYLDRQAPLRAVQPLAWVCVSHLLCSVRHGRHLLHPSPATALSRSAGC